ncbi:MAG TPA: DUF2207 domain-containing protein, partial [Sphingomicrobium sp.]|nr:DUF2207 domain-containing protein [Sphingomicrobium sp.]
MPVRRLLVVAVLWLATLLLPAAASAEERILDYHSDIAVQPDSSLLVTETIIVRAEGNRIRRGIYRDFPTRYKGARGSQVRVGFELLGVTRNGAREPAATEPVSNGVRVRIGSQDVYLEPGEYRYSIRYRTTRQLGRFADFDELYWNVTGNGWVFPIDRVEARITLPSPAAFGQRAVYTGPQGASGKEARVISERPGEILFRTTAPLGPYEGLTVAVAWPKGVVADASVDEQWRWWLADYGPPVLGALALAGILGFYVYAWKRAGRDPRPGTVVPLFSPPDNLSPAAMRYVWKMGADNRAFAAALVDMGVKGHVRLVEEDGGWFSSDKTRIERLAATEPLPNAEQSMLTQLAMTGESIVMEKTNHAKFTAARKMLDSAFKKQFEGKLFHRNWGWVVAGILIFIAGLWLTSAAVAAATAAVDLAMILLSLGALAVAALLSMLINDRAAVGKCLLVAGVLMAGALALATGAPVFLAALQSGWLWPMLIPLLALPAVISAIWWMSAPTLEGRGVLDRIAGFRQY